MTVTEDELVVVADQITSRIGYLEVLVDGVGSPPAWSCAELLAAQEAGEDPTARWRARVGRQQERYYRSPAPPQVGAAFVFQWYLGVLATPAAFASTFGPWVLDLSPETVRFDLSEPEMFPCAVSVRRDDVVVEADERARFGLAERRYREHAQRFADSYRPGVKFGSRQRTGMVDDCWWMATDAAALAIRGEQAAPRLRASCCFIYALPGAHACAACPRHRLPAGA